MNKEEKRAMKLLAKEAQRESARHSLPLPPLLLRQLFDHLDCALGERDCDHTNSLTHLWLERNSAADTNSTLEWLRQNGGHCDCEVLANSEQAFLFAIGEEE